MPGCSASRWSSTDLRVSPGTVTVRAPPVSARSWAGMKTVATAGLLERIVDLLAPRLPGRVGPPVGELDGAHHGGEHGQPVLEARLVCPLRDDADLGTVFAEEADPALAHRAAGGVPEGVAGLGVEQRAGYPGVLLKHVRLGQLLHAFQQAA